MNIFKTVTSTMLYSPNSLHHLANLATARTVTNILPLHVETTHSTVAVSPPTPRTVVATTVPPPLTTVVTTHSTVAASPPTSPVIWKLFC